MNISMSIGGIALGLVGWVMIAQLYVTGEVPVIHELYLMLV